MHDFKVNYTILTTTTVSLYLQRRPKFVLDDPAPHALPVLQHLQQFCVRRGHPSRDCIVYTANKTYASYHILNKQIN